MRMEEKYLIFTVGEKYYALPSRIIGEVAALEEVFPLPLVFGYVRGIINRYSVPYALVDIRHDVSENALKAASKVIVLKEEVDKLALLINDVVDFADTPSENLMEIEPEESSLAGSVSAFFEWKGKSVFCLKIEELISRIRQDFAGQES